MIKHSSLVHPRGSAEVAQESTTGHDHFMGGILKFKDCLFINVVFIFFKSRHEHN